MGFYIGERERGKINKRGRSEVPFVLNLGPVFSLPSSFVFKILKMWFVRYMYTRGGRAIVSAKMCAGLSFEKKTTAAKRRSVRSQTKGRKREEGCAHTAPISHPSLRIPLFGRLCYI